MHNVKRGPQASKHKDQAKIVQYLSLTDDVLTRKKSKDYSSEAFDLTTRLLKINPEFYTVWNYRRNICLQAIFPVSSPEAIHGMLSDDLAFTMNALKGHPKVYWIWNHRRWCLENVPNAPNESNPQIWKKACWERELAVVEKMLDADARNFMAWDYRRYVLGNMPVSRTERAELAYTTRKIESSFSNFSAWHQRSKVYTTLCAREKLDFKEQELELVRNAMYTDPDDQSVWIYHRWLIGGGTTGMLKCTRQAHGWTGDDLTLLQREIVAIEELLNEQPDSKCKCDALRNAFLIGRCAGCIESIVHYKRLLQHKHGVAVDAEALKHDCQQLLLRLRTIDPLRRQRYEDMAKTLA